MQAGARQSRFKLGGIGGASDHRVLRGKLQTLLSQALQIAMRAERKDRNRSGWRATTSNALTPIEPVEPGMVKRCCIGGGLPSMNKPHGERQYWQQRVDAVQHAAVTGQ